jgi:hypothetical protein
LEQTTVHQQPFAFCFDQILGARDGSSSAEKSEFSHRAAILNELREKEPTEIFEKKTGRRQGSKEASKDRSPGRAPLTEELSSPLRFSLCSLCPLW